MPLRDLRPALQESFARLGGIDYLVWLGKKKPSSYVQLLRHLVPDEKRDPDSHNIIVLVRDYTGQGPVLTLSAEPAVELEPLGSEVVQVLEPGATSSWEEE